MNKIERWLQLEEQLQKNSFTVPDVTGPAGPEMPMYTEAKRGLASDKPPSLSRGEREMPLRANLRLPVGTWASLH